MRTTVTLDNALLEKAEEYTGVKERSALINRALETLIQVEAGRRLALLGGSMPNIKDIPRRRSKPD